MYASAGFSSELWTRWLFVSLVQPVKHILLPCKIGHCPSGSLLKKTVFMWATYTWQPKNTTKGKLSILDSMVLLQVSGLMSSLSLCTCVGSKDPRHRWDFEPLITLPFGRAVPFHLTLVFCTQYSPNGLSVLEAYRYCSWMLTTPTEALSNLGQEPLWPMLWSRRWVQSAVGGLNRWINLMQADPKSSCQKLEITDPLLFCWGWARWLLHVMFRAD